MTIKKVVKNTKNDQKETLTKEDFLKALKKATRPVPKAAPVKGKKKTSA